MPKSIKFIASGSCSALGNFAPGDIARNISDDLASHLVVDARCAQYLNAVQKIDKLAPDHDGENKKPVAVKTRKAK